MSYSCSHADFNWGDISEGKPKFIVSAAINTLILQKSDTSDSRWHRNQGILRLGFCYCRVPQVIDTQLIFIDRFFKEIGWRQPPKELEFTPP